MVETASTAPPFTGTVIVVVATNDSFIYSNNIMNAIFMLTFGWLKIKLINIVSRDYRINTPS